MNEDRVFWFSGVPVCRFSGFRVVKGSVFRFSGFRVVKGSVFGWSRVRFSGVPVFRFSGFPVFGFSGFRVFRCSGVPVFGWSGVRFSGFPVFRFSGFPVFRFSSGREGDHQKVAKADIALSTSSSVTWRWKTARNDVGEMSNRSTPFSARCATTSVAFCPSVKVMYTMLV